MKILKICVAQNVGKVRISRKIPPILFHAISSHFPWAEKKNETKKKCRNFDYLLWWAHRPYSPRLGCWCYPPLAGMYVDDPRSSTCGGDARILEKQRMRSLKQSLTGATTAPHRRTEFMSKYTLPPTGGQQQGLPMGCYCIVSS